MKKLLVCILACAVLAGCGKADSSSEALSDTASPKESLSASAESKIEEASKKCESEALAVSSEASKMCESEAPTEIVDPPLPSENPVKKTVESTKALEIYLSSEPAEKSWEKAYSSFYSGENDVGDKEFAMLSEVLVTADDKADEKLVALPNSADNNKPFDFDIYSLEVRYLDTIVSNGSVPGIFLKCRATTDLFGTLAASADTRIYKGEGFFAWLDNEKYFDSFREFPVGNYKKREALTVTKGVEQQLLDGGFSPAETTACCLRIMIPGSGYLGGTAFIDEKAEKICFLLTNPVKEIKGLEMGLIYSFEELDSKICASYNVSTAEKIPTEANPETGKPVIYLYPEKETKVRVKLNYPKDNLTYTYPKYNNSWEVLASPDGTLKNLADGKKYYYLFWEGDADFPVKFGEGFSVRGRDTEKFLEEKLPLLGLNEKESNDFIAYWVPKMQNNEYNLIKFAYEEYEELASLEITPAPESILRVHMVYTPANKEVKIKEQELPLGFVRKGFTVIEWGGTLLNKLS